MEKKDFNENVNVVLYVYEDGTPANAYLERMTLRQVANELREMNDLNDPHAEYCHSYDANGSDVYYRPYCGDSFVEGVIECDSEQDAEDYADIANILASNCGGLNNSLDYFTDQEIADGKHLECVSDVLDCTAEEARQKMDEFYSSAREIAKDMSEAYVSNYLFAKKNCDGKMTKALRRAISDIKFGSYRVMPTELCFQYRELVDASILADIENSEKNMEANTLTNMNNKTMKKIERVDTCKTSVEIFFTNDDYVSVSFDGEDGLFTRKEYAESLADEYGIEDKDDQKMVMDAIESQYNTNFFIDD